MQTLPHVFSTAMFAAGVAVAQGVGPIPETFTATYVAVADANGPSCSDLLVTGQFLAPTPGYTVSLGHADDQASGGAGMGLIIRASAAEAHDVRAIMEFIARITDLCSAMSSPHSYGV